MVVKRAARKAGGGVGKRAAAASRPPRAPRTRRPAPLLSKREVRLMEGAALAVFVFLIVGALGLTSLGGVIVHSNQSAAVEAAVMVDLTNENRAQDALPELTVSPTLVEAAQEKADDEASLGYFAHTSPAGIDSWYWFKQAGYNFTYAGENLAVDFTDSAEVVSAWMNSPEHRANILDGHYTQIGIATASGMYEGHPTIFVVQEFGTPAAAPTPTVAIATSTQPAEPTQMAEASTVQASSSTSATSAPATSTPAFASTAQSFPLAHPAVLGESAAGSQARLQGAPTTIAPNARSAEAVPPAPAPTAAGPVIPDSQEVAIPITSQTALATPQVRYASDWDYFLASPATTLRYAYYAIAFLVLLALLLTTGLEFRMHHLRATAVAGGLVLAMLCLFLIANATVFTHPVVAQAASAAAYAQ